MTESGEAKLARIEERVDLLLDWRDEMRKWCDRQDEKIASLVATANRVEGGWRTLAGVGAVASAVSAAVTSLMWRLKGGG